MYENNYASDEESHAWSDFQGAPGNRGFPGADGLPGPKVHFNLVIFSPQTGLLLCIIDY